MSNLVHKTLKKASTLFSKVFFGVASTFFIAENSFAAGPLTDLLKKSEVSSFLAAIGGIIALYQFTQAIAEVFQGDWAKSLKSALIVVGIIVLFKYWGSFVDIMPL